MKFFKQTIAIVAFVCCMSLGLFLVGCGCNEKYTIKFDTQGGTEVKDMKVSQDCTLNDDEQNLPVTSKFGFEFVGWYLDSAGSINRQFTGKTKVTKDITVYAKWTPKKMIDEKTIYTVTFYSGSNVYGTQSVVKDEKAMRPANPVNGGLVFTGWNIGDTNTKFDFDTNTVTSDLVLRADWMNSINNPGTMSGDATTSSTPGTGTIAGQDVSYYIVEYHPEIAGEEVKTRYYVVDQNDRFVSEVYAWEGNSFEGWFTEASGGTKVNVGDKVTQNMKVFAHWKSNDAPQQNLDTTKVFVIKLNYNGGKDSEGNTSATASLSAGYNYTPPALTRDGYNWGGWFYDDRYTNAYTTKALTSNIELFAKWTPRADSSAQTGGAQTGDDIVYCVVNLYFWTGPNTDPHPVTKVAGSKLTASESTPPSVNGYVFAGWYTDSLCTEVNKWNMNTSLTASFVLYAKWNKAQDSTSTEPILHRITFRANCDVPVANMPDPLTVDVVDGQKIQAPTKVPTRTDGYKFNGWYSDSTGSTPFNFDLPITKLYSVYAGWVQASSSDTSIQVDGDFEYEQGSSNKVIVGVTAKGRLQTELNIPAGVTKIKATFGGNKSAALLDRNPYKLVKLTIPSSVTTIEEGAFSMCHALWIVDCKSTNINNGKTTEKINFNNMDTRKLYFANGENEMDFTGQRPMQIHNSIVYYSPKDNVYYAATTSNNTNSYYYINYYDKCTVVGGYCFYGCENLSSISISTSVEQIYYKAFAGCTKLSSFSWVGSVVNLRHISASAFEGCTALTYVWIPSKVSFIGANAFKNTGLTSAIFDYKRYWGIKQPSQETVSTSFTEANMSNSATAAAYLKSSYCSYDWIAYVKGDVNGDGKINGLDSFDAVNIASGDKTDATEGEIYRADLNDDQKVDEIDCTLLRLILAGNTKDKIPYTKAIKENLDVNADGVIDGRDMEEADRVIHSDADQRKSKLDFNNNGQEYDDGDKLILSALVTS